MRLISRPFDNEENITGIMREAYAYFPIEWGFAGSDGIAGDVVVDPLTVYVRVPFDGEDCEYPTWAFSLNELIEDAIDGSTILGGAVGEEHAPDFIRLRNGLNKLVKRIDTALSVCGPEGKADV